MCPRPYPGESATSVSQCVAGRATMDGEDEGVVAVAEGAAVGVGAAMPQEGVAGNDHGGRAAEEGEVQGDDRVAANGVGGGQ